MEIKSNHSVLLHKSDYFFKYKRKLFSKRQRDSKLLFLSVIGDEKTRSKLKQIYTYYKNLAYWTAYNILKDHHEAGDVIQEAIIKISKVIDNQV